MNVRFQTLFNSLTFYKPLIINILNYWHTLCHLLDKRGQSMKKVWIEFKKSMEDHSIMIQVVQLVLILLLLILCVTK